MNPADTMKGRDRAAELLRQALDTIEALPFTEPAKLDRLEQARNARDAVVLALRALGEDIRQPSRAELDADRPVMVAEAVWNAALDDTAELVVTPCVDADPVTGTPAGVSGIDCVGCGTALRADTLEQLRTVYETHAPVCPHTRSPNNGWHAPLDALFTVPGRFTAAANRR